MRGKVFKPKWERKVVTGDFANELHNFFRLPIRNIQKNPGDRARVAGYEVLALTEPVEEAMLDKESFSIGEIYQYTVRGRMGDTETSKRTYYATMRSDRAIVIYATPPSGGSTG